MIAGAGGDLVQRLFERLLIAVAGDDQPLTIGDLYQRLIPYRSIRSEIGVMELASYEHAFLRLLSGEGGHLEVDVESAAAEIRRELASPNPILGIYRDYPEVAVRIVRVPDPRSGDDGASQPTAQAEASDGAPIRPPSLSRSPTPPDPPTEEIAFREAGIGDVSTADTGLRPADDPASRSSLAGPPPSSPPPVASTVCTGCSSPLPAVEGIRFCPFCGQIREPFPCDRCGASIQPEWSYCIRCGASATPPS